MIHSISGMPTPKSWAMVGSEMLTMLPLRVLMKVPTETAESTSHFRLTMELACPTVIQRVLDRLVRSYERSWCTRSSTFAIGSYAVPRMAVNTVALEAGAKGLQRQGPEYPVNGKLGAIPLGTLGVRDELRGGGDQVRRVAVGALDAPGQVLERDPHHQSVLPGGAGRSNLTLLAQANVLHQERRGGGHRDGDEGEDEAIVERIREAFPGDLEDLLDELLPAGEGGSHAIQGVAGLVAHQRVRVFQGIYQSSGSLRWGIVHKVVSVTRGHERADNCRANRRA